MTCVGQRPRGGGDRPTRLRTESVCGFPATAYGFRPMGIAPSGPSLARMPRTILAASRRDRRGRVRRGRAAARAARTRRGPGRAGDDRPVGGAPVPAGGHRDAVRIRGVATYDLAAIADDAGAVLRRDTVEAVAAGAHRVRLASGTARSYDVCVLAVGARARVGVPGAITFRDQRDRHLVSRLLDDLEPPGSGRVVFAAPAGVSWTLPLYELALLSAAELERRERRVRDRAADARDGAPERLRPGGQRARGVAARGAGDPAAARLRPSGRARARDPRQRRVDAADGVVAVPRLVGRRIAGVPADWNGFVHTDRHGRVEELDGRVRRR